MTWTKQQIQEHIKVCRLLNGIKNKVFAYMRCHRDCTELEIQHFILQQYKKYDLRTALGLPIVAFGPSSAHPHYNPAASDRIRRLKEGNVIKVDVWGRLSGNRKPFGDITWMAYVGKKPDSSARKVFDTVTEARNASIAFIHKELRDGSMPTGKEVDHVAMGVLLRKGYKYGKEILHTTGHSIGTTSPHGRYGAISMRNKRPLKKNVGYTIEPGIYLKGSFGVRSEIDFYIDRNLKLHVTTPIQKEYVLL